MAPKQPGGRWETSWKPWGVVWPNLHVAHYVFPLCRKINPGWWYRILQAVLGTSSLAHGCQRAEIPSLRGQASAPSTASPLPSLPFVAAFICHHFHTRPKCLCSPGVTVNWECVTFCSCSRLVIVVMKFDDNELKAFIHLILFSGILHPRNLTFSGWSFGLFIVME